ncbi:MAG: response regulator [Chitinophagaceae bacterium]|nr:response regulator [Chitinophagaceae bacterium]
MFWSIYRDIVYSGLEDGTVNKDLRKKIVRFNQFVLLALLVNVLSVIVYFVNSLYISALINITSAYIFLLAFYFSAKGRLEIGRILSIINVNLYLIIISYVEGLRAGEYFLFFPYFLVLTFVVSIRRNYKELVIVYSLTIYSLILTIFVSPFQNDIETINDALYSRLYNSNLILSYVLTMVFSYAILRVNKDNEVAILQEKKFGDTIYNTSLDGVFIMYADSNIVASCNQRALDMFETQEHREIEGTHIENWFDEEHIKRFNSIEKAVNGITQNWQGELSFTTKTGKTFPAYVSVTSFHYKKTKYIKISILDIANVKMTEFELMKSKEKAEAAAKVKTRFLSNMSHELRTPLNGIIGSSNLLLQEEYLPSQQSHLDILRYSSEHMMVLINDILDYNKIEAGKLELANSPVNMKMFVERVASQFASQVTTKGLLFVTDVDDRLDMELMTDETRLNQILSNLLSNAIKFTHSGSITIAARKIFASSTRATLQFIVRDTGIGIPANKHREIFESFTQADVNTTRKYGGTGLGLSITKQLISKFNSELMLESKEGKGTTFHFTVELPINENRKLYINEDRSKTLASLEGVHILIAEDNNVNLAVAKRFLTKWGITVTDAVNGREAVSKFRPGIFDLLLIDLEMPEMDGATALREIRKIDPNIPILAFTAAVYDNIQADLLQKGFTDFIHKPFRPEDLHSKISLQIHARRA